MLADNPSFSRRKIIAIPTLKAFKAMTEPKGLLNVAASRGEHMTLVDTALEQWEKVKLDSPKADKIGALYNLWKVCSKWLKLKDGGTSATYLRRWVCTESLRDDVLAEMNVVQPNLREALERFQERKKTQGMHAARKSMDGVYGLERQDYLVKKKKSNPTSLTLVDHLHAEKRGSPAKNAKGNAFLKQAFFTDFGDLNYAQIQVLETLFETGPHTVAYLTKIERLQYQAAPGNGGTLVDFNSQPIDMKKVPKGANGQWSKQFECCPYAMDSYGNLFTAYESPLKGAARMNHSTFNAGKDVVCAGCLHVGGSRRYPAGQLNFISNGSGHYKPTRQNLHECVRVLNGQGTDLTQTVVMLHEGAPAVAYFYLAATFLNNPNAQPDGNAAHQARSDYIQFA